jgi:hypothetical protein
MIWNIKTVIAITCHFEKWFRDTESAKVSDHFNPSVAAAILVQSVIITTTTYKDKRNRILYESPVGRVAAAEVRISKFGPSIDSRAT